MSELKAHDGTILEIGQLWRSTGGLESLLIGFSSRGWPVFEKMEGWLDEGAYFDVEKYWKSVFVHELVPLLTCTGCQGRLPEREMRLAYEGVWCPHCFRFKCPPRLDKKTKRKQVP